MRSTDQFISMMFVSDDNAFNFVENLDDATEELQSMACAIEVLND